MDIQIRRSGIYAFVGIAEKVRRNCWLTIIGLTALNRVVSPCFVYNNVVSGILAFVILAPISHCIKHRLETLTEFSQ